MIILERKNKEYPQKLNKILDLPEKLYVLGNVKNLNKRGIAIIGSRVCTEEGRKIAKEFAFKLSQMGLVIISGMAKGIDTAAHIGALEAGERTIAVLGSGFKHIFPEENKELFKEIIDRDGTVITEYSENTKVSSKGFVQRNRIVSGLAEAVLVIEAKHRSGTTITAEFASKQGKKVFCIPHSLNQKEGIGTNKLLKQGAILVTSPEDIQKQLGIKELQEYKEKEIIALVPQEYLELYNKIKNEPTNIDEICRKMNVDINQINYGLTMLEIQGFICSMPGGYFKRI